MCVKTSDKQQGPPPSKSAALTSYSVRVVDAGHVFRGAVARIFSTAVSAVARIFSTAVLSSAEKGALKVRFP